MSDYLNHLSGMTADKALNLVKDEQYMKLIISGTAKKYVVDDGNPPSAPLVPEKAMKKLGVSWAWRNELLTEAKKVVIMVEKKRSLLEPSPVITKKVKKVALVLRKKPLLPDRKMLRIRSTSKRRQLRRKAFSNNFHEFFN